MTYFVGLDVSSLDVKVCVLNSQGAKVTALTITNDLPGAQVLRDQLLALAHDQKVDDYKIGLESTSVYSYHPAMFFHTDEALKSIGCTVYLLNPKQVNGFKKSYPNLDKTDEIDAFVIADFLRFGRASLSIVKEEQYIALQQLTRSRFLLVQQLTKEKQHFLQHLTFKFSQFTKEVDSSVFGQAMMDLFSEQYSLDELAVLPLDQLALFLQEKGHNRFGDPKAVAASIQKAVRASYRLGKCVEDSVDLLMGTSMVLIQTMKAQIKTIEKGIAHLLESLPQTLQTVPGIGPVITAGIIAEIGQIDRFQDETKLAKYAGLYWRKHQSGKFTAEDTSLSRTGNVYLRYYLIEAANSVKRYVPDYQSYYLKKAKEVPKHQHKRALVLTARKLVRLVDALLRHHQVYTPEGSRAH